MLALAMAISNHTILEIEKGKLNCIAANPLCRRRDEGFGVIPGLSSGEI
jgi:hypothetical protein